MTASSNNLADAVRAGSRRALARAITLVESTHPDDQPAALNLLEELTPATGNAYRIGVTGAPGVGKSTFIEALGLHLITARHRVAVLSVDPSSAVSGGSILGDKTRMENLARNPHAFIRPSPAGRTLGGVARRTREAMLLCEAAGFDVAIVETVGVGQSETAVAGMTDMFVLLVSPAGGDDLQAIKRGIMELADLVLINKTDGELLPAARRTAADYQLALGLMQPRSRNWRVPVQLCSALIGTGIAEAWQTVKHHHESLTTSGELTQRRAAQARTWLWNELAESVMAAFREHPEVHKRLPELEADVMAGRLPACAAVQELMAAFRGIHGR